MFQRARFEDIDYELTPSGSDENEQAWDVRILRGPFAEQAWDVRVLRFGQYCIK